MIQLFEAIGLGLVTLLPVANPLTTVVLFLGRSGGMTRAERQRQSLLTGVYVFAIIVVAYYGGQAVMSAFGISIPGLRIGGGLIVSSIGFAMLFPKSSLDDTPEVDEKSAELKRRAAKDIAFVPLAMPTTAGPGTIALVITVASTVGSSTRFDPWVLQVAPVLISLAVGAIVWLCLRSADLVLRFFGRSGIEAISRLMGFLLICIGVQFAINGILEIVSAFIAAG
jgi:multiple antibiotic resistance protein